MPQKNANSVQVVQAKIIFRSSLRILSPQAVHGANNYFVCQEIA